MWSRSIRWTAPSRRWSGMEPCTSTQCSPLASVLRRRSLMPWQMAWSGIYAVRGPARSSITSMTFSSLAPPASLECGEALATLDRACNWLAIPIAEHKREGPTTCLTFLGIEVDTLAGQLRLPDDKLTRLLTLLEEWGDRKVCERRELESLIGVLNHACKVVRCGRSFLRRMLDLLKGLPMRRSQPHPIRLNRSFRSDLAWWRLMAAEWNGVSFLGPPSHLPIQRMASDASGSWGCGAWYGPHWFQVHWDHRSERLPIMVKEFISIVLACAVWGPLWGNSGVRCLCDNQAVVACLRSRTSQDPHCMHLLRTLAFIEARHTFSLQPQYISTKDNHLADDLSRDNLSSFLLKVPGADSQATPLPTRLLDLLLDPSLDWVSPPWLQQFSSIFRKVSPPQPDECTAQQ